MKFEASKSFEERSNDFAALGACLGAISSFEHRLDEFVWKVAGKRKDVAKSFGKRPPHSFSDKFDFWRYCLVSIPELRSIPMYEDGYIHFTALFLMCEEIVDVRAAMAHGEITGTNKLDGRVTLYRFERIKKAGFGFDVLRFQIGITALKRIVDNAEALEWLLSSYIRLLDSDWSYEKYAKEQRHLRDNRKLLAELGLLPAGFSVDMKEVTLSFKGSV